MSTPPWGHKPPKVDDVTRYWMSPPPELSPRVQYWLKRISDGTWKPNRWFETEGYHNRVEHLGVYMWEYFNIIYPILYDEQPDSRVVIGTAGVFNRRR